MGEKIVYLGPYNNSNGQYLFSKALKYIKENKGESFYFILPNGKLLKKYRNKLIEQAENMFTLNLFTFDDVVDRLLEKCHYTHIDEQMIRVLVSKVLRKLYKEKKLEYYKQISNKKGFAEIVVNIIGELKRSLIKPPMYIDQCPDMPFYKEIGLIYEEYEKILAKNGFIDREGSFLKSLSLLREDNSFFSGIDFIVIDQFLDFRPQEIGLLEEMVKAGISIYINMPFNRKENFETVTNTLEILKDMGFEIVSTNKKSHSYFENMADTIFDQGAEKLLSNSNIFMIKAPNNYLEIKKIAEKIKKNYNNGVKLSEIGIVLANAKEYKDIISQVFEEESIPCSLDRDINLIEISLIKEIKYILELKKCNMDKSSTINRIKSKYFNLCEDIDLIEYILRKLNFKSSWELKGNDDLKAYNQRDTIVDIIEKMKNELEIFPDRGNIKDYISSISQIIDKYAVEEFLVKTYKETGNYNLLYRDFAALNKFNEILEKLGSFQNIFLDDMDLGEFTDLIIDYLEKESITYMQGNSKGVNILTPTISRGHKFKVLFIVGLSQGKYPNLGSGNFFFREDNYKELKNIGIDIKNYYERLDKESLIFTTMISTCTNKLYLTYAENSTGDEKDIPSMFLDEVLRIIKGQELHEKINIVDVHMDYLLKMDMQQLTSKNDISKYLIRKYYEGNYEKEHIQMYYDIDRTTFHIINNNILSELKRQEGEFNKFNGNIEDDHIIKDIIKVHKDKIYSISYLESYGTCPYYFLLNNILKVEEMERIALDFTPLDKGIIMHDILKQYYSEYANQIKEHVLGEKIFYPESTLDYIKDKMKGSIEQMYVTRDSRLWEIRIENNANKVLNFIKSDLNRLSKLEKKVVPMEFEKDFGKRQVFEIKLGDMKIPFTGTIDRIDKYVDEDKYILIDYKNSASGAKNIEDMKVGLSLQIPIYILSQNDNNIVAGLYGIISNGEFKVGIGNVAEKHLINKRNKGAITQIELEELLQNSKNIIQSYISSIFKGDFSINPKRCPSYCMYKNICRYEEKLEVE